MCKPRMKAARGALMGCDSRFDLTVVMFRRAFLECCGWGGLVQLQDGAAFVEVVAGCAVEHEPGDDVGRAVWQGATDGAAGDEAGVEWRQVGHGCLGDCGGGVLHL